MNITGLRLIDSDGAGVYQLPHDIGDGAVSLGLVRMVERATADDDPAALVMARIDRNAIIAGLAVNATLSQREAALRAIADNEPDWTATGQGAREVRTLVAFIAPRCSRQQWQDVLDEMTLANDQDASPAERWIGEQNLALCLRIALGQPTPVREVHRTTPHSELTVRILPVRLPHNRTDPGPGAA